MRKIALIIGVLGLGILIGLLLNKPLLVENIDNLIVGGAVEINGVVEEERKFGSGKLLIVRDIPVFCECYESYIGKMVSIDGIVEKFPDDLRIRAFRVEILD